MAFTYPSDVQSQLYDSVQGQLSIGTPSTIASAATIAPNTYFTFVTGTTQVATVQLPYSGWWGSIMLCFTNGSPGALLTSGNIALAITPVQNRAFSLTYDPSSAKWYPSAP